MARLDMFMTLLRQYRTLIVSVLLMLVVFSTELFLVFFVFSKLIIVGIIDLHHKLLSVNRD